MNPNNVEEREAGFLEILAGAAIIFVVEIVILFLASVVWKAVMP